MKRIYLIDIPTIQSNSIIDNDIPQKLIIATLYNVQQLYLEPLLGTSLYNRLLSGFVTINNLVTCTLPEKYKSLVDDRISEFLIAGVVYLLADNILYKYTGRGIQKEKGQYSETVSSKELEAFKKTKKEIFDLHASKLRLFLENNSIDYPEFNNYMRDALNSFENTENDCGIYCDVRVNPSYNFGNEFNPNFNNNNYNNDYNGSSYYDNNL